MDVKEIFRGKKITLLGLGLLGRGIGDAAFLAECGAELIVSDKKSADELSSSVEQLKHTPGIVFHLGEQPIEDFLHRDLVVKAAGVPLNSPHIAAAKAAGVPVVMSTALFAKYARGIGARLVGVTGTRGKSTVTQMIFRTLEKAGKRALLGGNIRGRSTLAQLPFVRAGDIVVLELDSWQLQGFGDLQLSPEVAVFSNLMPDHMNYYGGSMDRYFADKANIFAFQKAEDALVIGPSMADRIAAANPVSRVLGPNLPDSWQLQILGAHNRENAGLAKRALEALGLSDDEIRRGLESFEAIEGRLQFLREIRGVKIYNDNNATTPEATIAALRSFAGAKNIILIAGGSDKHLDLTELRSEIERTCKKVLLLDGAGTKRLLETGLNAQVFDGIIPALAAAKQEAGAGDIVLFSPGFASFGMFKNEYDRNDQFAAAVAAL